MCSGTLREIFETDDPYVAASMARCHLAKVLSGALASRIPHFESICRTFAPDPYKYIQLAASMYLISPELSRCLCRIEDIFNDRNAKQMDLESKSHFSRFDRSELSKHDGFANLDSKHVFIVWLVYTLNNLEEEIASVDDLPLQES